ncbi:transposase [Streptomyces syringium]|uniref:transposase n=1 Tax=Streptomyces syringium TaxID=76729 RepID=UPI003669B04A
MKALPTIHARLEQRNLLPAEHLVDAGGKTSRDWAAPPSITPYIRVKFDKDDCGQCPVKSSCTRAEARQTMFLPEPLYDRQANARAAQETEQSKAYYAMRAGVESTISEFIRSHGMRQCRYRGEEKTHVQHVLTAIAINIERNNAHQTEPDRGPRPPTPLRKFLDGQGFPRQRGWRNTAG